MSFNNRIKEIGAKAVESLWEQTLELKDLHVNETKPEFEGEYTLVTFSLAKIARKKPAEIAEELGKYIIKNSPDVFTSYNVINGFLNLSLTDSMLLGFAKEKNQAKAVCNSNNTSGKIMVEFSSPNTNKPLHFGHLRNNFLAIVFPKYMLHMAMMFVKPT